MAAESLPTIGERLRAMTITQKVALAIFCVIMIAFIIVFFAYEKQVFELLEPAVDYIRKSSAGMVVLGAIMAATCIFPLFGYGAVSMICGYVYGIPMGFIPAFFGDIIGASAGFCKYIFRKFGDNIEFREMSKAVSTDGIFILFLIRLSSFPFAVLNAYFGAMTQLPYWKFILATTLSTPRLFLPIFIGQNISSLADPTVTGNSRIIKWAASIAGIIIALAVGWYIYRHTTRRIERINAGLAEENEDVGGAVRHTRAAQYDAVINMEEIERIQDPPQVQPLVLPPQ
ncbi:Tlg2-vesicle protein [Entomortierella chlamydospora]|uniref:Golgi apparatus membrane protein TVP38 n=1 Tax=Entomortierella chlamydospora TaxID=101097 RepID=A0A9P6SYG3_9FUNG|nr:Tlg2-vesicle protein [Entomortierella chlamydospora]